MPKPQKIELPADLTQPFPIPEGVTQSDIDQMIAQLQKDADTLLGDKGTNVEGATWLLDTVDQLNGKKSELVAADAEAQQVVEAARERLAAGKPKDGDQAAVDAADDDDDDDKNEPDPDGSTTQTGDVTDALDPTLGEPVLVASSAAVRRRNHIAAAARASGAQPLNLPQAKPREAYLTAASEIAGFAAGQTIDFGQLGLAADKRFGSLPNSMRGGGRVQLGIGAVHVPTDEALVASATKGDFALIEAAMEWAVNPERLARETGSDGSLLAAGGWCAPSETLYDLLNLTTQDGLLNIPGITVNRGGVRYTLGPNFATVYNAGQNFTKTETQAIAGSPKPIVNIPCPSFADHRMVVDGMYLTGDILSQKGYPEAYADYLQKSLTAFAHYVNAATIADMETLSTQVDMRQAASSPTFYENPAISTELLGAIEIQVLDMRYRNRLSMSQAVEVVLPYWLIGALRSDLAKRQGVDDAAKITGSDITDYFALRGASVQWVYDWQDAFSGVSGGFGAASPITSYPTSAKFLIYPQGTFVRALSDVIELNAVYDSTLLTTNQYVALFMEQARLTLLRGWDAREVQVHVQVTGATGLPYDYTSKQPNV